MRSPGARGAPGNALENQTMKANPTLSTLLAGLLLLALQAQAIDAPPVAATAAAPAGAAAVPSATAAGAAASTTVTAPALAVDEILDRNARARGGLAAWQKVHAIAYSGKIDAGRQRPGPDESFANPNASPKERRKSRITRERELENAPVIQLPFSLEVARGRKSRMEIVVHDKTAVQVYDGHSGWKLRPYLGPDRKPEAYSAEELKLAADQADIDGWLLDAKAKHNSVVTEGVEAVDGKAAYKLKVTLANGDTRHVWVDADSFLDVKVEGARRLDGKIKPMYTALKDYRTVDGVKLPFLMETRMEGFRDAQRIVIEKASLNPTLAADRFAKP